MTRLLRRDMTERAAMQAEVDEVADSPKQVGMASRCFSMFFAFGECAAHAASASDWHPKVTR